MTQQDSSPFLSDVCPGLAPVLPLPVEPAGTAAERSEALVRGHLDFVWRLVRRLGLIACDADDITQRVFSIAVQRIDVIQPGSERAYLYRMAVRLALKLRAANHRQSDTSRAEAFALIQDPTPAPDALLDQHRARQVLDQILEGMDMDLKTVLILFELENLTLTEVAETLGIPRGTAASRLRRAREDFDASLRRLEARMTHRRAAK
ncbi:MAG: sigma-70 family RNA polymerase sigma factor [Polyangiaceae bacterium]